MGRVAEPLAAKAVSLLRSAGYHAVGTVPGLYLQISEVKTDPDEPPLTPPAAPSRSWILRTTVGKKRREIGLGGYPGVTLAMAHAAARDKLLMVKAGTDPIAAAKAASSAIAASQAKQVTFRVCALACIEAHASSWKNTKHAAQWTSTLQTYAFPFMGNMLVGDIDTPQVLAALEPIWKTKTETASRVRGRIESVLDWATTRKYREGLNPARWKGHLNHLLPAPGKVSKVEHHPALPYADAAAFMAGLRSAEGMGARALEFAILTAARSGEVRGATWAEIDEAGRQWTIPGERMKVDADHRVPLSGEAMALLKGLPRIAGTDLAFSATRGNQLSDATLSAVIKRMNEAAGETGKRWMDPKLNRAAVPHGFRSTFTDWATEIGNYSEQMTEMALAHVIKGQTKAAYMRGDMFDRRRKMMRDWAAFLATPYAPAKTRTEAGPA
jgi:integrase